nr:hypothetical protein [Candidatus Sigynarchaeota archaeon]
MKTKIILSIVVLAVIGGAFVTGMIIISQPRTPAYMQEGGYMFNTSEPESTADALGITLLFDRSFPAQATSVADTLGANGSRITRLWKYLASNPQAKENFFSEVLYDYVNRLKQGQLPTTSIDTRTENPGLDMNYFAYSYSGRNWGAMMDQGIEFGTAQASREFQVSSFLTTSPLVLDLDGNGIIDVPGGEWRPHPASSHGPFQAFDIDGNGLNEVCEWLGKSDGLLTTLNPMIDLDMDGSKLFGSSDGWSSGFSKLAQRDTNKNGTIEGAELSGLNVWQDTNQDAFANASEIQSVASLGITSISLQHHDLKSTFVRDGTTYTVWDWYPNVINGLNVDENAVAGLPLPTITIDKATPALAPAITSGFDLDAMDVAALNLSTASICTVTDQGRLILLEHVESLGYHRALIVLYNDSVQMNVTRINLPVYDITSVTPLPAGHGAFVVADGGTKLIEVLFNGTVRELYHVSSGVSGFRFGAQCSISSNTFFTWGSFFDTHGNILRECIASFPLAGGTLISTINMQTLLSDAGGRIAGASVVSSSRAYFARVDADIKIMSLNGGTLVTIDSGTRFDGLWGTRAGAVYIMKHVDVATPSFCFYNATANTTRIISEGNYAFPVLSANGDSAISAMYNYGEAKMNYSIAKRSTNYTIAPLLSAVPIGPLRLSDDGSFYAYISSQGIKVDQT